MGEKLFSLSENLTSKNNAQGDHFKKAALTALTGCAVGCVNPIVAGIIFGPVTFYQVMAGLEAEGKKRG